MKSQTALAVLLVLTISLGCQHAATPPADVGQQILVTVATKGSGERAIYGGSRRSYHGQEWPISLHTQAALRSIARAHDLHETDAWPIDSLDLFCVVFSTPAGSNMSALLAALRNDNRIVTAAPMQEYHGMLATTYDDPLFELQYGDHQASLSALHGITRGEDVRIGVIDSHVDVDHPDLDGQIRKVHALVQASGPHANRHGTAVVGIIGAAADNGEGLVGLAPAATIHAYAACEQREATTRCTSFYLAQALDKAIAEGIHVLNLSLAGPRDPLLRRLIEHAMETGMTIVAAANRDHPERNFPAALAGVHAAQGDFTPWFARREQFSTQAGGGYQVFYGSSVSAAGVAGAAALLRTRYSPRETNELLRRMLNDECDPAPVRTPLLDNLYKIRSCP